VREAAVLGVPGADGTPELALVVALDGEGELADLRAFLAGRLAPHQVPTRYHPLDALPFSPNGKVRKKQLRERFARPAVPQPAG
jgi:fatty-acyl-CoA synthase